MSAPAGRIVFRRRRRAAQLKGSENQRFVSGARNCSGGAVRVVGNIWQRFPKVL